jgi:hypothetical protein
LSGREILAGTAPQLRTLFLEPPGFLHLLHCIQKSNVTTFDIDSNKFSLPECDLAGKLPAAFRPKGVVRLEGRANLNQQQRKRV